MKTVSKKEKIFPRVIGLIVFLPLISCNQNDIQGDASGTFESTEIIVSSEASGKILELSVLEGSQIDSGQLAGYIDSTQLHLKRMQLLASVKAMDARQPEIEKQIAVIREQISVQEREKLRIEKLLAANAATTKQMDDINSSISVLKRQLEAQRSSLANTSEGLSGETSAVRIQVEQLNDQIEKCRIKSPVTGRVLVKYAEKGEIAAAGKPLFKIADTENMFLRAYITADLVSILKVGDTVRVFADFGESGSREYEGNVSWISDKAEFTPKAIKTRDERANLVYAVKIAVKNDGYLKIGMYGEIKIPK